MDLTMVMSVRLCRFCCPSLPLCLRFLVVTALLMWMASSSVTSKSGSNADIACGTKISEGFLEHFGRQRKVHFGNLSGLRQSSGSKRMHTLLGENPWRHLSVMHQCLAFSGVICPRNRQNPVDENVLFFLPKLPVFSSVTPKPMPRMKPVQNIFPFRDIPQTLVMSKTSSKFLLVFPPADISVLLGFQGPSLPWESG